MQTLEFTRDALARSAKAVTMRPSVGQYTHKTSAIIHGGTKCRVREKHLDMEVDVPASIGGGGEGPTPGALMRGALTSCIAIGVKLWAARADVKIDFVDVQMEADVDARGELGVDDDVAPGILDSRITIFIRSNAPAEAIEDIIARSLKYSPLYDVYSNEQQIQMNLKVANTDQFMAEGTVSYA